MEENLLASIRHQINIGDRKGARTALAELLEEQPDNADAWALLAILLTEPAEQAQCYREILRIKPEDRQAALWLESLTSQASARRPAAQELKGRECPRCGEMIRVSPMPGSPDATAICPYCGFPVPLTEEPKDERHSRDGREAGDAGEAEWIPEGIDLEQLLEQINLSGAADEHQPPAQYPATAPGLTRRHTLRNQLLARLRRGLVEEEAEDLLMGPIETASAAGALTPELILRLAGGPLAPEQRRECPTCGAVVPRTAARCPWCSAPLPDAQGQ